ncbi:Soluble P-type ATPase [Slackia heliotrinireducens]|uniref:Soluble P-type ATPase n=1 Tax=Slackia heliotrinireducens (strain ATCC 29202 / DSM 20476 / NCTC 11029 / RHS 1) TaxID=471855 RepID=C7N2M6_SLAHD|nr:HAD family hydrolase [Slackia heliotrinireducens]ACV23534.1 soluble P-type ATPase [Slackia heliotrinireducens DSM 20476]VEH02936.1 Soluble P-type ATPase [Slackia heliotrinireducens]
MRIDIPGWATVDIEYVICDYNGTIAVDGMLIPELAPRLERLAQLVEVHVLTADTFGTVREQCAPFDVQVDVFPSDHAALSKQQVAASLPGGVCCLGNGFNDRLMFQEADLAIAIMEHEGASVVSLNCADVVVSRAADAFDLLLNPKRLIATLRG